MLETKIAELTAQIAALIEVLKANAQGVQPEPEPKPKPDEVSLDTLRDACLKITRLDPNKKPEIVAVISRFNGAEKIQDVAVANRLELLAALEQLWQHMQN
jgi:hypothetical protein